MKTILLLFLVVTNFSLAFSACDPAKAAIGIGLEECIEEGRARDLGSVEVTADAGCNIPTSKLVIEAAQKYTTETKGWNQTREPFGPTAIGIPQVACTWNGGSALDYGSCAGLVDTYNAAFASEQVLNLASEAQKVSAQRDATTQISNPANIQTSSIDATKTVVDTQKSIERQKEYTFMTIAAGLGAQIATWRTGAWWFDKDNCESPDGFNNAETCEALRACEAEASVVRALFPNTQIRGFFVAQATEYAGKAAMHGVLAGQYKKQSGALSAAKKEIYDFQDKVDDAASGFINCQTNPSLQECVSNYGQIDHAGGGGIDFGGLGDTGGNIDFDPEDTGDDTGSDDYLVDSGLSDEDKSLIGEGLIDLSEKSASTPKDIAPAAAQFQLTGGSGGGAGGGGGAGAGGGGAPSLSDTPGEAQNSEGQKSLISSKSRLGYTAGGPSSLGGRNPASKPKNPLDGLFGGKKKESKGGVNVDRTMASEVAPAASGLFKKISKRYGKAVESKRIEQEKF